VKLLVIEDDAKLVRMLERGLSEEGYAVTTARDAETGLERLRQEAFDACILDVRLPGMDGFTALAQARKEGIATAVLMLTARDAVPDRVRGLSLGADDYLVKPFAFAELTARLQAIARRGHPRRATLVRAGGVELDPAAHLVAVAGKRVELSPKQFALLELLLRNRGQVVARAIILEQVFGYAFDPGTNLVDVHISNLRQRLDLPGHAIKIQTVRGVGYRLDEQGEQHEG
jgi:two-component system OmpR family response regulator